MGYFFSLFLILTFALCSHASGAENNPTSLSPTCFSLIAEEGKEVAAGRKWLLLFEQSSADKPVLVSQLIRFQLQQKSRAGASQLIIQNQESNQPSEATSKLNLNAKNEKGEGVFEILLQKQDHLHMLHGVLIWLLRHPNVHIQGEMTSSGSDLGAWLWKQFQHPNFEMEQEYLLVKLGYIHESEALYPEQELQNGDFYTY